MTQSSREIDSVELLDWLEAQDSNCKIYWRDRNGESEFALVGVAHELRAGSWDELPRLFADMNERLKTDSQLRYFGGISFSDLDDQSDDLWRDMGYARFVLPSYGIEKTAQRCRLFWNEALRPSSGTALRPSSMNSGITKDALEEGDVTLHRQGTSPDFDTWTNMLKEVHTLIDSKMISKLVLSRRADFMFDREISALQILRRIQVFDTQSYHFMFQFDGGTQFLGGTPERLYKRDGAALYTEALAGTRPRGESENQDEQLTQELKINEKERAEHDLVVAYLSRQLRDITSVFSEEGQRDILKLAKVQHLLLRFRGQLLEDVGDIEILSALHPTPAVAGYPRDSAQRLISELEPYSRGWYSGPVGWVSRDCSEFVVAIRSGILQQQHLSLFSGAGIVAASDPLMEWDELNHKIQLFLELFK